MAQDDDEKRASKDNTDFVHKPDDMTRDDVAPRGSVGMGFAPGGPGMGSGAGSQAQQNFGERFSEPAPQAEPEQNLGDQPLFEKSYDPDVDKFYEEEMGERPITQEEIDAGNAPEPEAPSPQEQSFSERFNTAAAAPNNIQDGPDLSLPGQGHGPDRER